jgi:squalene-hopene/tetraprenyl-beta-curcumene cyclase
MKATSLGIALLTMFVATRLFSASPSYDPSAASSWASKAAAYLDQRESWWMAWPASARDQGTFCISCHTALPYALARPRLRRVLGEEIPSPNERRLLNNVKKRVRLWKDIKPFYGANTSAQSRGTEGILNALILANNDEHNGKLGEDTRSAFDNMWALQQTTGDENGAWPWLDFGNEPFEAGDSQYYGASLAAVAIGTASENYRASPSIQHNLNLLRDYLSRNCARQSLINQVAVLWASAKLPGLLARVQQQSIINRVLTEQRTDGGWSLSSLAWTWRGSSLRSFAKLWLASESTPLTLKSDAYATGLIVYVLEQLRLPNSDLQMQHGLAWLVNNQSQREGGWAGYSLNHRRPPSSPTGHFMSDAATAYAVLALTETEPR